MKTGYANRNVTPYGQIFSFLLFFQEICSYFVELQVVFICGVVRMTKIQYEYRYKN